jgi:hypothetical protein
MGYKGNSSGRSSGSSRPSSGKGSASYGRGASPARLSQRSGTSFGGYTKVAKSNGGFTMKRDK